MISDYIGNCRESDLGVGISDEDVWHSYHSRLQNLVSTSSNNSQKKDGLTLALKSPGSSVQLDGAATRKFIKLSMAMEYIVNDRNSRFHSKL